MKKLLSYFTLLSLMILVSGCSNSHKTEVFFVPSFYKMHTFNSQYSYDDLKNIVGKLNPDIVAVEIRAVDIDADSIYLASNYPYEMHMARYWFPNSKIAGIDWVGDDLKDERLSEKYWREVSSIRKQERALAEDTTYFDRLEPCREIARKRMHIVEQASLKEILNSEDAALTKEFYTCLDETLKASPHYSVAEYYQKRKEKILENLQNIIKSNPGKTIVVITGDDHYVYLKDFVPHESVADKL